MAEDEFLSKLTASCFPLSSTLSELASFLRPDTDTELMRAVDVVMVRAKRIYILIIKVNKLFSFFSLWCFLNKIENIYFVFLSSYTNTRESLGELEKAVGSCSHSISRSPKLPLVFV